MLDSNRDLIEEYIEQHESSENTRMLDFFITLAQFDNQRAFQLLMDSLSMTTLLKSIISTAEESRVVKSLILLGSLLMSEDSNYLSRFY